MYISVMATDHKFVLMDKRQLYGSAKELLTKDSYIEVYDDDSFLGSIHYTTVDLNAARENEVDISKLDFEDNRMKNAFKIFKKLYTGEKIDEWRTLYKTRNTPPVVVAVYVDMVYTEPNRDEVKVDLISHIPSYVKLTDNADVKDIVIFGRSIEYVDHIPIASDNEIDNRIFQAVLGYTGFEEIDDELHLYYKVNDEKPQLNYL